MVSEQLNISFLFLSFLYFIFHVNFNCPQSHSNNFIACLFNLKMVVIWVECPSLKVHFRKSSRNKRLKNSTLVTTLRYALCDSTNCKFVCFELNLGVLYSMVFGICTKTLPQDNTQMGLALLVGMHLQKIVSLYVSYTFAQFYSQYIARTSAPRNSHAV